ncbi:hypothetical protein LCGC14_1867600 [marine sediment metagenome]|uniref:TFIIS-type domain-containing protein n=2 Tax=root TaxID=1 RepID=A0A0F9J4P0_9ZZZZ|nr:MAG: transcription factor S-II [Marseillevirus LCMAC202]
MDAKNLIALFKLTTKLKPGQTKALIKIILQYEEAEELAYTAIGLLNNDISYKQVKEDFLAERFGWEGCPYAKHREARSFRDNILAKPPEVRDSEIECPICHYKKTLVVEMQTRSADEGYTYYIHCFNPQCRAVTK